MSFLFKNWETISKERLHGKIYSESIFGHFGIFNRIDSGYDSYDDIFTNLIFQISPREKYGLDIKTIMYNIHVPGILGTHPHFKGKIWDYKDYKVSNFSKINKDIQVSVKIPIEFLILSEEKRRVFIIKTYSNALNNIKEKINQKEKRDKISFDTNWDLLFSDLKEASDEFMRNPEPYSFFSKEYCQKAYDLLKDIENRQLEVLKNEGSERLPYFGMDMGKENKSKAENNQDGFYIHQDGFPHWTHEPKYMSEFEIQEVKKEIQQGIKKYFEEESRELKEKNQLKLPPVK